MHAIKSSFSEFASCISENKQTKKKLPEKPETARLKRPSVSVLVPFCVLRCVCVSVCVCLFREKKRKFRKRESVGLFFYKAAVLKETLESLDATMW